MVPRQKIRYRYGHKMVISNNFCSSSTKIVASPAWSTYGDSVARDGYNIVSSVLFDCILSFFIIVVAFYIPYRIYKEKKREVPNIGHIIMV